MVRALFDSIVDLRMRRVTGIHHRHLRCHGIEMSVRLDDERALPGGVYVLRNCCGGCWPGMPPTARFCVFRSQRPVDGNIGDGRRSKANASESDSGHHTVRQAPSSSISSCGCWSVTCADRTRRAGVGNRSVGVTSTTARPFGSAPIPPTTPDPSSSRPLGQASGTLAVMCRPMCERPSLNLVGGSGCPAPTLHDTRCLERVRAGGFGAAGLPRCLPSIRLTALAYQVWEKSRPEVAWERMRSTGADGGGDTTESDLFTAMLRSLCGSTEHSGERTDELPLYFAAYHSDVRRPAMSLESMLAETFGVPVSVWQFQARQVRVDDADAGVSRTGRHRRPRIPRLGQGVMLGTRIPVVQTRFRIRIGAARLPAVSRVSAGWGLARITAAARAFVCRLRV